MMDGIRDLWYFNPIAKAFGNLLYRIEYLRERNPHEKAKMRAVMDRDYSAYRALSEAGLMGQPDYLKGVQYANDSASYTHEELVELFASSAFQLGCLHGFNAKKGQ